MIVEKEMDILCLSTFNMCRVNIGQNVLGVRRVSPHTAISYTILLFFFWI